MVRTINIPCGGIQVSLGADGGGTITSELHTETSDTDYDVAIDAIESLILAHACAGVDVASPEYVQGIETALDSCSNHYA